MKMLKSLPAQLLTFIIVILIILAGHMIWLAILCGTAPVSL